MLKAEGKRLKAKNHIPPSIFHVPLTLYTPHATRYKLLFASFSPWALWARVPR